MAVQKPSEVPGVGDLTQIFSTALKKIIQNPSITNYVPQDHQIPFHESEAIGRVMLGGNRSGKTVAGATEMVQHLCGIHAKQKFRPPLRCRAIGVDFDDGIDKIIKPEIARWIPPSYLIDGSWDKSYSKGTRTLTLSNGSFLEFMSYDQDVDKFAGTSRHHIWFDEEPPEDIFNENMLRLVDTGGSWWMTMTPLIDMSYTYDRFVEPAMLWRKNHPNLKNPQFELFQVSSLDNKFINKNVMEALLDGFTEEEKSARLEGKYFSYTGAIYSPVTDDTNFLPSIHNTGQWPSFRDKWGHFAMMDAGYNAPTAFLLGCFDNEGRVIIYYEHYQDRWVVDQHADAIHKILSDLRIDDKIQYMVLDPAAWQTSGITGTSVALQYAEKGLYFTRANNDVSGGILRVSNRLRKKMLLITDNCVKTKWELARYRWAKWDSAKAKSKNNVKDKPMKKDDHAMDALRYGIASRPQLIDEMVLPLENVISAPVVSTGYDESLRHPDWYDDEELFDDNLGTDW